MNAKQKTHAVYITHVYNKIRKTNTVERKEILFVSPIHPISLYERQ